MSIKIFKKGVRSGLLLLSLLLIRSILLAQTGPGGVGSSSNTLFWFKADALTGLSDVSPINVWQDQTGNSANAIQKTGALQFDGVDDEASGNYLYTNVTHTFTMEAWVKPSKGILLETESGNAFSDDDHRLHQNYAIFPTHGETYFGGTNHSGVGISVGTNGVVVYEFTFGLMTPVISWAGSITDWKHIAVVYNQDVPSLYVDGVFQRSGVTTGKTPHPSIMLGGGSYGHYIGSLDEVRVWSSARSQSEISANMNVQKLNPETNLIGNWRCDESSGTSTFDGSGVAYDLTLKNGTQWTGQYSSIAQGITPTYYTSHSINGKPVIGFNGNSRLEIPSLSSINSGGPYSTRSMEFVLKTGSDVTTRQVIYDEGNTSNGFNVYIDNGFIYLKGWNTVDNNNANVDPQWGKFYSAPIQPGHDYILSFVFDKNRDVIEGFLNGSTIASISGVGDIYKHTSGNIGFVQDGTLFHDGPFNGSGYFFNGYLAEVISYSSLNSAERKLTENYLASKYGIVLTNNDFYSFESTYGNDIRGIGKDDDQNSFLTATSDFLTISSSTPSNGYFSMFGHDNQSISSYLYGYLTSSDNTPKNVMRVRRTWRIDATTTGNLNFRIPQSSIEDLVNNMTNYQMPVLVIDEDGDFKSGSKVIGFNDNGVDFYIDNIEVPDNAYISFGMVHLDEFTDYSIAVGTIGKADVNYESTTLMSYGLSVTHPSSLDIGDYLLLGSNVGSTSIDNNNTPDADIVRSGKIWKANEYGDVGQVVLGIDPNTYPLPSGKDMYVILIDRNHDGNFTDAEVYGCVKEGNEYKAYYNTINNEDMVAIGATTSANNILQVKELAKCFKEKSPDQDLTNHNLRVKKLILKDQTKFQIASPCVHSMNKATLNLLFNTGKDYIFGSNPFTCSLTVEVKGYNVYNTTSATPIVTYNVTLPIDQTAPEILHFIDVTDDYQNKGVKVYEVRVTDYNPSGISLLNGNLELAAYIDIDEKTSVPVTDASPVVSMDYTTTGKVYNFTWDTDNCGAPSYQFQLLKLFNTQEPANADEHNIVANVDWTKALTLETTNKFISLTMVEGTGYYAWRVRPIGSYYDGGATDSRNWGTWSTSSIDISNPVTLNCSAGNLTTCLETFGKTIFYCDQFDRDKNFIYNRAFTEDNKIHEGISYANGLLQVRQTQAKVPSNNDNPNGTNNGEVIAGQTLYDYSGRAALSTMSAPILDNNNELGYRPQLMKTTSGNLYGPQNFDTDSKLYAPDPVDPVNGGLINYYYSDNNSTELNVPSAENYPFARTVFDNDGTGRTIENGSAGLTHRVGNGHTVRVNYSSVSDQELIRVFGDEAPDAASVHKIATTDQNNITSIAYIDKAGKTIATCLSKNGLLTNLEKLSSEDNSEFTIHEVFKSNQNLPYGNNGLHVTKTLSFASETILKINYEVTPTIISSQCGSYCSTCGYLIKVKIIDLNNSSNNKVIQKTIAPGSVQSPSSACSVETTPLKLDETNNKNELELTLPAGKYMIEKIIEPDQTAAETYASNVTNMVQDNLKPKVDAINQYLDNDNLPGLLQYLQTLQTSNDIKVEVYGEDGNVLFSIEDPMHNSPLAQLPDGSKVKLKTTCCSLEVPIMWPEYDACKDQANNGLMGVYFANYLQTQTGQTVAVATNNKYTDAYDLNILVQNMLAELDGAGNHYYTCDQLLNCWKSACATYGKFNNIDIKAGAQGQDGFSDFPQWTKDKVNNSGTMTPAVELITQFLECANYHYKGYTTDATLLKYKPYKYFYYDRSQIASHMGWKMCENAFCNYSGDPEDDLNTNPTYSPCLEDMCTKIPTAQTDNGSTYNTLNIANRDLTEADYYNLSQCLKNLQEDVNPSNTPSPLESVTEQKEKLETECRSSCDNKYNYFLSSLQQLYGGTYRAPGSRTVWGPELMENGDFGNRTGGWYQGTSPGTLLTKLKTEGYNVALGAISTGNILISTKKYQLTFRLYTTNGTVKVYNGGTLLYQSISGSTLQDVNFSFDAVASNIYFVSGDVNPIVIDNVSVKQSITYTANEVKYEDMCGTARRMVDYCKEQCNLTIIMADCDPLNHQGSEDKLISLGTTEEIKIIQAIINGTFQLDEQYPTTDCGVGYHDAAPSLHSYYGFNKNTKDGSGFGFDGTGNSLQPASDKSGVIEKAFAFDGNSSSIDAGVDNRNISNQVTLAAWIDPTAFSNGGAIVSKYSTVDGKGYELILNGNGTVELVGRDGNGVDRTSGSSTTNVVSNGQWHQVIGVVNNNTWQVWVDGVNQNQSIATVTSVDLSNTDPLTIGNSSSSRPGDMHFDGTIDEVFVFNKALTPYQIQQLYNSQFTPYTQTPVSCSGNPYFTTYPDYAKQQVVYDSSSGDEDLEDLISVDDGYVSAGTNHLDYYIRKTDKNFNTIWKKTYGGYGSDWTLTVDNVSMNGNEYYVMGGISYSTQNTQGETNPTYTKTSPNYGESDSWITVINPTDGSVNRELIVGGNKYDDIEDIQAISNGFVVGGVSSSDPVSVSGIGNKTGDALGSFDGWFFKVDQNFNIVWQKTFGGTGWDAIRKVLPVSDGYYLVGFTQSSNPTDLSDINHGADDGWIVRTDLNGCKLWEKRYGGSGVDMFRDIVATNDGNYVISGMSYSQPGPVGSPNKGANDLWVLKINPTGGVIWEKTFGGPGADANSPWYGPRRMVSSVVNSSNGYIIATTTQSPNGAGSDITEASSHDTDGWVINVDVNGNLIANKRLGTYYINEVVKVIKVDDENFVAGGRAANTNQDFSIFPFGFKSDFPCKPQPICIKWISPQNGVTAIPDTRPPVLNYNQQTVTFIKKTVERQLQNCQFTNKQMLIDEYNSQCANANTINDKLEIEYKLQYHHYTLYYYDRAGNLVKTVPPAGVDMSTTDRMHHPAHTLVTTYKYNSLGQLVSQNTPDGGMTNFIYNKLGQLRFSQNDKQLANAPNKQYSYTKYDYLGRSIEVGEADLIGASTFTGLSDQLDAIPLGSLSYPTANTSEQTFTVYSEEAGNVNYLGQGQRYLQNRVSYVYSKSLFGEKAVTYFSYDPHGNVEWLSQEIPGLSKTFTGYEYDLISNKVLKVNYNENLPDQFYHKYDYDADNRITAVYTSKNGRLWDKDASYKYYKHGPLKRTEIGEDKLQGLDYAYTIQGWLKGVNTPRLNVYDDPGNDGNTGSSFARDEYGMSLGYFEGDFKRTGSVFNSDPANGNGQNLNSNKPLYNGNISSWVSRIEEEYRRKDPSDLRGSNEFTTGNFYTYDHLNRILESDFYRYNGASAIGSSYDLSPTEYKTTYTYDPNGNIIHLLRNGTSLKPQMDDLSYTYVSGTNKLQKVSENPTYDDNNYTTDIDNQQFTVNYCYDEIGNLIEDKSEKRKINWNVYGKVSEVKRNSWSGSTDPEIRFTYDASGNRIKKEVNTSPYDASGNAQRVPDKIVTTYYVRDASGNIMSVYERNNSSILGQPNYYTASFTIKEQPIYGSSRVGQYSPVNTVVAQKAFNINDQDKISFETEIYERSGEYKNWEGISCKKDQFSDLASQQQTLDVANLHKLTYNDGGDNITSTNQLSFLGKAKENVSIAEDSLGNVLFYAVTADKYWGKDNACLVYDAAGRLMPGTGGITGNGKAQSVIVKHPGKSKEYYLVNVDIDGRLKATVIDMSLAGNGTQEVPAGDVKSGSKNIVLDANDNTNYGTALQALEDNATGKAIIYATRHTSSTGLGTMDLVSFAITEKGSLAQTAKVLATSDNLNVIGQSELKLSEDGRRLLLFNHKLKKGWFDHQESEIKVYNIGYDYGIVNNRLVNNVCLAVPDGTKQGVSAEFDNEDRFIYYTRDLLVQLPGSTASEKTLWRYDLRNGTITQILVNDAGDIRRGKDGRIYLANVKDVQLPAFSEDAQGNTFAVTAKNIAVGYTLTGALSAQNHKIYVSQDLFGTVSRKVDLKLYEMSDHLGNVTVVLSDLKNAVISGTDITNTAKVITFNNYYPFGMEMPGRHCHTGKYRYGYNGKEFDSEWNGNIGAMYDYGFRIYDPRIAKFLSVDPLTKDYPWYTPYQFAGNTPIQAIDLDGAEEYHYTLTLNQDKQPVLKLNKVVKEKYFLFEAWSWTPDLHYMVEYNGEHYAFSNDGFNSVKQYNEFIKDPESVKDKLISEEAFLETVKKNSAYGVALNAVNGTTAIIKSSSLKRSLVGCFVKGTIIRTEKGLKNIEDIKVGDSVWSYNEATKNVELKEVKKVFVKESNYLIKLTVGTERIFVTAEHPFYINYNWIPAKKLHVGDSVFLLNGSKFVISEIVNIDTSIVNVYNFEVIDNHNYYVSNRYILVHNTGSTPTTPQDLVGFRKDHILNRHKSGAGKPGKTEFPSNWSDEKIIDEVNKIANNPGAPGGTGAYNAPYKTGTVDGIEIRVDFYPPNHPNYAGKVSTAYPTNVTPNPN